MKTEMPAVPKGRKSRRVVLFSGNAARPSGSRRLAGRIGEAMASHMDIDLVPLDLVDAGRALGSALTRDELPSEAQWVISELESAEALVVVTSVHNGSYPGLFKHFVDFLDRKTMAGKPVLLGASGGSRRHAAMIENQLVPLFSSFQAQISAYSVFEVVGSATEKSSEPQALSDRINLAARHFCSFIDRPAV